MSFSLLINSIFDSSNLSTLRSSAYYLPFNEYPYGHLQYPPPYSQRSFPPPFLPMQRFPPHVSRPLIFPTHPSSLRRRLSRRGSLRVERQMSNLHSRATSLKKVQKASTKQPPAFPTSGALSSVQLARGRPHGWRSGYKSPSKSYLRRHFESFIAPYSLTSKFNHNFLESTSCERSTTFLVSNSPLHVDATFKTQFPVGSDTCRSPQHFLRSPPTSDQRCCISSIFESPTEYHRF